MSKLQFLVRNARPDPLSVIRMAKYAVIEAPSVLGLKETGVDQLPDALLSAGLAERLRADRIGRVAPPPYSAQRDPEHGMLNAASIARYTVALAEVVGEVLDRGSFPIVLGGDCSILLGNLLALRRRGRFGLLFADGHTDFYQPEANINGEAASSDLALATGRGPETMTKFEGHDRLVRDADIVALGFRDEDEQRHYGSQPLPPEILALNLAAVRRLGVARATRQAIDRLSRPDLAGFWIHLDADVLDDAIMPAVDYRLPDGLSWDELVTLLRHARASPHATGMEITIYNPSLDSDRSIAHNFVMALAQALAGGG